MSKGLPRVSVGIPVFNGEEFIAQAVQSILDQRISDLELVISDNCSTDATEDVCRALAKKDDRIVYIRQKENIGVFRNHNAVFGVSQGAYFKWQSANDWCAPSFLETCLEALEETPDAVLAFPQCQLVDDTGQHRDYLEDFALLEPQPSVRFELLMKNLKLNHPFSGIMRADVMRQTGLNRGFRGSDIVFMAEMALRGTFVMIADRLWYRRMTATTWSGLHEEERRAEFYLESGHGQELEKWWMIGALISATACAPVPIMEKIHSLGFLSKQTLWWSRELVDEIRQARLV